MFSQKYPEDEHEQNHNTGGNFTKPHTHYPPIRILNLSLLTLRYPITVAVYVNLKTFTHTNPEVLCAIVQMNPISSAIKDSHDSNSFVFLRNSIKDYIIVHHCFSKSLSGKIIVRNQVVV